MALAAVAAAEYGYGKQTVDYSHVPYYNFDWESQGEGKGYGDSYGSDSYGEVLRYGQKETRSKDDTQTNWWTELPGKSHIKRDDQIHAIWTTVDSAFWNPFSPTTASTYQPAK